jgi:hypothetical protein
MSPALPVLKSREVADTELHEQVCEIAEHPAPHDARGRGRWSATRSGKRRDAAPRWEQRRSRTRGAFSSQQ